MIHISKRVDFIRGKAAWLNPFIGWAIRILAVLLSLVVSGILIYSITKLNPIQVYIVMGKGVFGTSRRIWAWLRDLALLLCISVGLAPAFKMRFWNIGAEGQVLVGGIATAACMIYLGNSGIPTPVFLIIMAAASMLAGMIWGVIPALFKAKWNTNETLFTLMMNYIAIQLTSFFIPRWEHPKGSNTVGIINAGTKAGWIPALLGRQYLINILIVAAVVILMYFYLKKSKHGYEIAVVGQSENTARYAAMNVKKVIIRSMALSGAICGLGGFLAVSGADHTISTATAGGRGFVAIIVAWLAKFNTLTMVLISAMLIFLEKGAIAIASEFSLSNDVSKIITGIILFFILGSEFFINYEIKISSGAVNREAVKKNSAGMVRGNYWQAVLLSLLGNLLSGTAIGLFVFNPVRVGLAGASRAVYNGEKFRPGDVFSRFKKGRYLHTVGAMALVTLFITLGLGCLIVPGVIVAIGLSRVPYLLAAEKDGEKTAPMDILRRSWSMMKGHKTDHFVFRLTFIGWAILNFLTFGILGLFWVNPYFNTALAGYHEELVKVESQDKKEVC